MRHYWWCHEAVVTEKQLSNQTPSSTFEILD